MGVESWGTSAGRGGQSAVQRAERCPRVDDFGIVENAIDVPVDPKSVFARHQSYLNPTRLTNDRSSCEMVETAVCEFPERVQCRHGLTDRSQV
jgi:hypothetical protein